MQVVAKFQCHNVANGEPITDSTQTVKFGAVYEQDEGKKLLPENAVFGKYTPWGDINMGIGPVAAKEFFKPGKKYYVTFTEASD